MSDICPQLTEPLRGHVVVLREWEDDDADWYIAVRDEEIFRWTTEPRELQPAAVREALHRNRARPAWVGLAITDAASGALLGNIALRPTGERPGEGEISYWLAPAGRGRGAATESVQLLVTWALDSGAFDRIVLKTMPGNAKSQAVALRAGFTLQSTDESSHWFALERPSGLTPPSHRSR